MMEAGGRGILLSREQRVQVGLLRGGGLEHYGDALEHERGIGSAAIVLRLRPGMEISVDPGKLAIVYGIGDAL